MICTSVNDFKGFYCVWRMHSFDHDCISHLQAYLIDVYSSHPRALQRRKKSLIVGKLITPVVRLLILITDWYHLLLLIDRN